MPSSAPVRVRVTSSAGESAGAVTASVCDSSSVRAQPEVGHAHDPVLAEERVGRLEVAMDQSGAMRGRQPARRLQVHVDDLAPAARPGPAPRRQILSLDELHDDAGALADPHDLVDGDDVAM